MTTPGLSTTASSRVATPSVVVALFAWKVTLVGGDPLKVEPLAVTSTSTVKGSERG